MLYFSKEALDGGLRFQRDVSSSSCEAQSPIKDAANDRPVRTNPKPTALVSLVSQCCCTHPQVSSKKATQETNGGQLALVGPGRHGRMYKVYIQTCV